ncbi:hypothetical protein BLGI_194 [Brevibacillus laterosporus GI-9]|nr:hypothetical protein BLGI_194 [Brevibacillus laterosporus GI-9]
MLVTREQEIAEWGWTKQQQEEFLQMQYTCQKRSYESNYPHMEWKTSQKSSIQA